MKAQVVSKHLAAAGAGFSIRPAEEDAFYVTGRES